MQPLGVIKTQRIGNVTNSKLTKTTESSTTEPEEKTAITVKEEKITPKPPKARSSGKTRQKIEPETEGN
jgi:hypothetical protein